MRIIICGAGRVGQGIARHLSKENHDITMIDANAGLMERVQTDFDVQGVVGHAAHPEILKAAGADAADMLIAVTHFDEINMVICEVADTLFSVSTKIARVRAKAYLDMGKSKLFSRDGFPIDLVISPEKEVGEAILRRFHSPSAVSSVEFEGGIVNLLGIRIEADNPIIDTPIDQIAQTFDDLAARVVGINRAQRVFAPRSGDTLQIGDTAYVAVARKDSSRLNRLFNKSNDSLRRAVIIGGGNVGLYVAKKLEAEKDVRVRLVELNASRANHVVSQLNQTIVLHGDGLSREILVEAGADIADIVISVTDDDKTNLLIGKLCKQLGTKRAHALVNSTELVAVSKDLDIDAVLDPRELSVSRILTKLRRGRILNVQSLEDGNAEVAEGVTLASSPLIGKPVDYDDLPDGITAAAVIRDHQAIFPDKDFLIETDDRLILFYESSLTRQVEKYFRVSSDFF